MVTPYRLFVDIVVILLCIQTKSYAKKSQNHLCPIGFKIAFSKHKDDPICYRLKGPESFADSFEDCAGNLYTSKLYYSYNVTKLGIKFWTEYRNLYPGGTFVDWSYTESTGDLKLTATDVTYDRIPYEDEDLCVVIDPISNFTAVSCDTKAYRYCFVKPYSVEDVSNKGCEKFKESVRFFRPWPTCLVAVTAVGGGAVRATWKQAEELCEKRGGSMLGRGWRYSNNPYFETTGSYPMYPLNIVSYNNHTMFMLDSGDEISMIERADWNFEDTNFSSDTTLGAVRDHFWHLVNSSYIFYDVLCETPIHLNNVNLTVTVDVDNKIILTVDQPIDENDIYCFAESMYYPISVKITHDSDSDVYILRPKDDGYYWCTHIDTKNFRVSESNKQLFIREKKSLLNVYSVKFRMKNKYNFDNLEKFYKSWERKLTEYIFYTTKYIKVYGDSFSNKDFQNTTTIEQELKNFKSSFPSVNLKDKDIIRNTKVKRLYLDAKSALVHVEMNPDMMPVPPGNWDDLEVLFMKAAFYCPQTDAIPTMQLGSSIVSTACVNYSCIGDFNQGVQWVSSKAEGCRLTDSATNTARVLGEVTMIMPTVDTRAPEVVMPGRLRFGFDEKSKIFNFDMPQEFELHIYFEPGLEFDDFDVICLEIYDMNSEFILVHAYVRNVDVCDFDCAKTMAANNALLDSTDTRDKNGRDVDSSEESTEKPPTTDSTSTALPTEPTTTTDVTITNPTETIIVGIKNTTQLIDLEVDTRAPRPTPKPTSTTEAPTEATEVPPCITEPTLRPRPSPEEQLQQVIEDLGSLINNETQPVSVETISGAFDQVDELLAESEELEIPGKLLHLLDGIGARMNLNGSEDVAAVRENFALLVADAQPRMPVMGLRIAARDTDVFTDNAFEIIRDEVNSTHLQSGESEVVVQLPTSVGISQRRISFVVFRTDRAFQNSIGHYRVNSRVLSINVENLTKFDEGEVIDIHLSPKRGDIERNQSRACAYWHFFEDGTGFWSQEGCTFIASTVDGVLDTCRCDHLTHFAEILIPRTSFSSGHETALEIISIIGCVMSIVGLLLVGLTAILFRSWRRDFSNKIWLQLCVSILVLVTCFLIVVFAHFDEYSIPCMLVGVLLHYSTLASFCWMLVAAVLSYRRLVMVFTRDASHKLLKASAFAWGAPCAVVGILLSVAPHSYADQFEGDVPSGAFCYPTGLGLWLAVYAPIALMLVANWTLFALIVRSVFASRRIQRHGDTNEALRCASVSCLLVFLFGLPWVFALFLSTNLVTIYLFTFTATFQGFVLFVFFVLGNKKTRDLWLNKLKIKQTRKVPVTSSTYTNRSTGNAGWRGASATSPASTEAKNSKPRSLASPDDSRFS